MQKKNYHNLNKIFKGMTEIARSGLDENLQTINVPEGMTDHFKQILPEKYHEFIVEKK